MNPITWWRTRHARQEERVARVLRIHPDMTGRNIAELAGLGYGQVYVVLARMEVAGMVTSRWAETTGRSPYRRRLYRLAAEAGTR